MARRATVHGTAWPRCTRWSGPPSNQWEYGGGAPGVSLGEAAKVQLALSDDGTVLVALDFATGHTDNSIRHFTRSGTTWTEDMPVVGPLSWSVTSIAIDSIASRVVIGALG